MPKRLPSYRLHKGTGQGYTSHKGKCIYFGPHGDQKSHKKYKRWLAGIVLGDIERPTVVPVGSCASVSQLIAAFWDYVQLRYVKNGEPTTEQQSYKSVLSVVNDLHGDILADDFGPVALEAMRQEWLKQDLARKTVNRYVSRVVRCWKWGVSKQIVSVASWQALSSLEPLRPGQARDNPKVRAVSEDRITAIKPYVSRQIWAMLEFQLWTGCRPNEAFQVRMCDIDKSHAIWEYRPSSFKTQHRDGSERVIFIGPHAQKIVTAWERSDPNELLWQPHEAWEEWMRKNGTKKDPTQTRHYSGEKYTASSYCRSVERGCENAFGCPVHLKRDYQYKTKDNRAALKAAAVSWRKANCWSPNQLRHTAATRLRKAYGIELARIILGHRSVAMTAVYAEQDREQARQAMRESG